MAKKYHASSVDGAPSRPDPLKNTERGAQTRDRILDAAEQIFSQRGYSATRIEDIATAVGIRKPSVIHHFSGKLELHGEVINRIYCDLLHVTHAALQNHCQSRSRIFELADTWLDFVAARPTAGRLFLRSAADNSFSKTEIGTDARELLEIWCQAVKEAAKRDEFTATEPLELLAVFSGAALMFVSVHPILAGSVDQSSNNRGLLEPYRDMLHKAISAILVASAAPPSA